ncbi:hypothetical protein KKF84_12190 [Myxococcota bacterium]|nr:hypothetical protein [Myxococcota bacterium]MBU1536074.1 hypothetical protein [Myxococcota bacterium]
MIPIITTVILFGVILTVGFVLRASGIKQLRAAVEKAGMTINSLDPLAVSGTRGTLTIAFAVGTHVGRRVKHLTTDFTVRPASATTRWVLVHRDWDVKDRMSVAGLAPFATGSEAIDAVYLAYAEDDNGQRLLKSELFQRAFEAIPQDPKLPVKELGINLRGSFSMTVNVMYISEALLLSTLDLITLVCSPKN